MLYSDKNVLRAGASLLVSYFCFEGETLVLITPVPGHCLHFTTVNVKAVTNQ